jgi:hypothetical protein
MSDKLTPKQRQLQREIEQLWPQPAGADGTCVWLSMRSLPEAGYLWGERGQHHLSITNMNILTNVETLFCSGQIIILK